MSVLNSNARHPSSITAFWLKSFKGEYPWSIEFQDHIYIYIYKFVNCACIWLEICGFCACNAWFYDSLEGNICICLDWRHIYCDSNSWNAFDCPITVEQIISDIIEYLLFIVKSELNTFDNYKIVKSISDLINWYQIVLTNSVFYSSYQKAYLLKILKNLINSTVIIQYLIFQS